MTSNISGHFVILDSEEEFRKNFSKAICKEINYRVEYKLNTILQECKKIVLDILTSCAFYIDVANGKLDADLGFKQSEGKIKLDNLFQIIINEIDIQFRKFRFQSGEIQGGVDIFILEDTFQSLLKEIDAIIITDKFQILEWLRWFLLEGNKVIIFNYQVQLGNFPSTISRSGQAIMTKGGMWKVPTQYAGTQNDNALTRAIDDNIILLQVKLAEVFKDVLES